MSAASQRRSASPRIMICGLGSIGRRHLRNLQALGVDDLVLLRSGKATLPDEDLAGIPVEHNLAAALDSWKPDGVVVSNPTSLHAETALAALRAGSYVLLEKPVSPTTDLIPALLRAERESAGRVLVGYQFRYHPGLAAVQDLLNDQAIGMPVSVSVHWGEYLPGWHPWEDYRQSYAAQAKMGGGVVLTLSHPIDYLRWMFGEVRELFAVTGNASRLGIDVEDFADVNFKFRNGITGMMHLDYYRRPKKHDLTVVCENGTLHWDYKNSIVTVEKASGEIETIAPPGKNERNQMYLQEMSHFLDVCEGDSNSVCSYQDGKKALIIAHGILMSGRHQERVIFEE